MPSEIVQPPSNRAPLNPIATMRRHATRVFREGMTKFGPLETACDAIARLANALTRAAI